MEFDHQRNAFTMSSAESAFLGVPGGATEWPLDRADELNDLVDDAATKLLAEEIDPSDDRALAECIARVRNTQRSFLTILSANILSDDNLAREFGDEL